MRYGFNDLRETSGMIICGTKRPYMDKKVRAMGFIDALDDGIGVPKWSRSELFNEQLHIDGSPVVSACV